MNEKGAGPVAGMRTDAERPGNVAGKRGLTVICYLAADTGKVTGDLRADIRADLAEMRTGMEGVGPEMDCVAMFDDGIGGLQVDCKTGVFTPVLSVNMGDPATLMGFIDWAVQWYPAQNYAVIVGSHGSGPKADDIYHTGRTLLVKSPIVAHSDVSAPGTRSANMSAKGPVIDTLSTVGEAPRAIAFDDTSRSFLSIPDLRRALEHGVAKAGKPFACILFDCCYMAEYSTLLEMQGLADFVVASPEAIPGAGMPYTDLLSTWGHTATWPGWSIHNLAIDSVACFLRSYSLTLETASLLAMDMAQLSPLVSAMDKLGTALLATMEHGCARPMIHAAVEKAQRTSDPDFVYLQDLALCLRPVSPAVDSAAIDVAETVIPVVAASWGHDTELTWGPTVYLPRSLPAWYKLLHISSSPFGEWLMQYVG